MSIKKSPLSDQFWAAFKAATGTAAEDYSVTSFGDSAAMADELLALVLAGQKRATASLRRDYDTMGEPLPRVGNYVVVTDGSGTPRCIWRTTEVVVKPLIEGDEAFAWDEGEGDRTLEWWLTAHRAYFANQARRQGFEMHDAIETVFERFEVLWPPEFADRPVAGIKP